MGVGSTRECVVLTVGWVRVDEDLGELVLVVGCVLWELDDVTVSAALAAALEGALEAHFFAVSRGKETVLGSRPGEP
jgi:hypothetical protein